MEEPVTGEDASKEKEEKEPELAETADKGSKTVFKDETENKGLKKVRFLKPMPAFVGPDMETLGPFDEGQVAELDGDIIEILINNDAVELM